MNNPENAQAKSLIINYVVIILLLSLLWLLYEGVRNDAIFLKLMKSPKQQILGFDNYIDFDGDNNL